MSSNVQTNPQPDATRQATARTGEIAQRPTLLFFHSPTSGGSRRVEGYLAEVLQRRRNHDTFAVIRVEYESHVELAAHCGIARPPGIVVIEEKRVRARIEEPRGCVAIQSVLSPWLK